jgi:hypothetical protein
LAMHERWLGLFGWQVGPGNCARAVACKTAASVVRDKGAAALLSRVCRARERVGSRLLCS